MKNTVQYLLALLFLFILNSCSESKTEAIKTYQLENTSSEALNPYLTHDNKGNAVLCWTEKNMVDSLYRLKYAVYDSLTNKFNPPITVTSSKGTKSSPESMNKVAFKSDGTVIAVYSKAFENEKSPYAGAICYSMSADKGKSWLNSQYIHSDTAHHYGRNYFDIATLKNGEIAAIWLDGRYGKADSGSAIFFNRTEKGKGFGENKLINKNTCECCRTELLSDGDGNIHIAYRSITYPQSGLGKQVRDMVYTSSSDYGKTFSKIQPVSKDNWEIEGCPHTGPSLAVNKNGAHALWFTAGGNSGLYYAHLPISTAVFNPRFSVSTNGKHPQMIALKDGSLAMVWEEVTEQTSPSNKTKSDTHDNKMKHGHSHGPTPVSRIRLNILKDAKLHKSMLINEGKQPEHHAVITSVNSGLLLAWVKENKGKVGIYYSFVKME